MANQDKLKVNTTEAALFALSGTASGGSNPEVQILQQELLKKILHKINEEEKQEEDAKKIQDTIRRQMLESAKRSEAEKELAQSQCNHFRTDTFGNTAGSALRGQRDHQGYTHLHCIRCLKEFNDMPDPVTGKKKTNPWPHDISGIVHMVGGPQTV